MSVICTNHVDSVYRCFVKGSPEKIKELCISVPNDYNKVLE